MLKPNNDRKNSKLLLSLEISLKNKTNAKLQSNLGRKAAGKISKDIPIAQINASCSAWLTMWLCHYHLCYPLPINQLFTTDQTISIIHQVKAFGCPVFCQILRGHSYGEALNMWG